MEEIKKQSEFEVKEGLSVEFVSQNLGLNIIGTEKEKAIFTIEMQTKKICHDEQIKINYHQKTNTLKIDTSDFEDDCKIIKSKLTLEVPFKTNFIGKIENGEVSAQQLEGNINITSENGNTFLKKIKGNAILNSENGVIKIRTLVGDIKSKTENGVIKIEKAKGKIDLETENGVIKIAESTGELISESENGAIKVVNSIFEKSSIINENGSIYFESGIIEKGDLRFENERGKIKVIIPEDVQVDVTAKNQWGSVQIGLEGSLEKSKEKDFRVFHLVKGNGNVKVNIINEMGSIIISRDIRENPTDKLEQIINSFANDENIKEKIEKGKKIIKEIKENILEKQVEKIETKTKNLIEKNKDEYLQKGGELADKVKKNIDELLNKAFELTSKYEKPDNEEVAKRSRMKILQLLQDGKITAEQAEKLLNALEKNNAE